MSLEESKNGVKQCCGRASYLLVKNGISEEDADEIIEQIMYASIIQGQIMLAEASNR